MEWTIPDQDVDLRQGDILVNRPLPGKLPSRMLVVVTADCDIAQNKFGTHLACLRVVWYSDYVRDVWSTGEFEKAREKLAKQLGEQMRSAHKTATGIESGISDTRAIEWLEEASPEDIADALSVLSGTRKKFITNLSKSHSALVAAAGADSAFQKLTTLRAGLDGVTVEDAAAKLAEKAQTATLPDDVFMLPGLPGFDDRPVMVLLRQVVALPATEVVFTRQDATSEVHCIRVGRLLETFKYALSQAFGHLYARIGLPATYEARRRDARAAINYKDWA